jgi:hypothetical protein
LGYRRLISLSHFPYELPGKEPHEIPVSDWLCRQGVAKVVAQEKAENLDQLHKKITALGAEKVKTMVLDIFEQLLEGGCRAMDIAGRYGLDKVTFSRFAGTQWALRDDICAGQIPVLWKNTARMLACDDRFVEAAKQSGLWDRIKLVNQSQEKHQ